jgi:hypothetical protein
MQPGSSRLVGVDLAGGPKKHFVLTEIQGPSSGAFFAPSVENKTDASAIMGMLGKD